jgi:hypothetical protein
VEVNMTVAQRTEPGMSIDIYINNAAPIVNRWRSWYRSFVNNGYDVPWMSTCLFTEARSNSTSKILRKSFNGRPLLAVQRLLVPSYDASAQSAHRLKHASSYLWYGTRPSSVGNALSQSRHCTAYTSDEEYHFKIDTRLVVLAHPEPRTT